MSFHISGMAGLWQTVRGLIRSLDADTASSRLAANARGIELLGQCLSPTRREQYEKCNYFDVIGGDSGKRYRIRHGHQMNVEVFDKNGTRAHLLCFMPAGRLPVGDVMLAQKIALELFETEALKVAHRSPMWDYVFEEELRRRRRFRY